MTLADYLRLLRQQWVVIVLGAAVGLALSAGFTYRQTPEYEATTLMFVSVTTPEPDLAQLQQGSTFTQQRVKGYAELASSPALLESVIGELSLPYSDDQLADRLTATNQLDTTLISLTVRDTNAQRAADIVNALAVHFPKFVYDIETPAGQRISPVKLSVTTQAKAPKHPVSPRIPLNLGLGLFVGLMLGLGLAFLRDQLRTTINSAEEVERLTGGVPLGIVPFDPSISKHPLVTSEQAMGRAEAFRALRTNLQFADVDRPPRVIVITSPLPGEGKTTSAVNIALTMALTGARVILLEGDLRRPAIAAHLGLSNGAGLTNVLAGQHQLADVIITPERGTLSILTSGPTPPNPSELLGSQQMSDLINTLANSFDTVVIDAPPLLPVTDAAILTAASDGALLILRHGKTRREEATQAIQTLAAVSARLLGTVLNGTPAAKTHTSAGYGDNGFGSEVGAAAAVRAPREAPASVDVRTREPLSPFPYGVNKGPSRHS